MQRIYLDNTASTAVSNEVFSEMLTAFSDTYGNPNSQHSFGRDALSLVDKARDRVARTINADRGEIYFTSGGTESNNWALFGLALANKNKGNHIITSCIEHESVLEACKKLETMGFEVTYLPVNSAGLVDLASLLHYINQNTILVSVMAANNEVGTIQNLKTISKIVHEKGVLFHTDAVQAIGNFVIDVKDLDVDALSMSAHKIGGPKGVGALFVKKGVKIDNLLVGGEQERGKRAGTLNVPGIVGFGKACEITSLNYIVENKKLRSLRDYFTQRVFEEIPNVVYNGHTHQRLPGLVNLSFSCVDNEALMTLLDLAGICVSIGSACSSGTNKPSYVLTSMGRTNEEAKSSLRFSFSVNNTKQEIDYVVATLKKSVEKLRSLSPLRAKKQ